MKTILSIGITFLAFFSFAQPSQTVRGTVYDSETNFPVFPAEVSIKLKDTIHKTSTSTEGIFMLLNVPVGKHKLEIKSPDFEYYSMSVDVNSGKQTVLEIKMVELITQVDEVIITAQKPGEVKNEMATVSAQQFSVEETERYAGSRGDPARMASNFAGVQGADDSRNDIIVRGNSPLGIVYKVEGIDIPNPSHFATSGSTGGPVSIINNKSLSNSDFFMSAFPAEYGNSISGIFDLKLRNGNNNQHEFTGQFGFLGTEVMAEGPLSKKTSASYLFMGRYSTLSLFQFMGIKIGTDAVPAYGDGAFKFNFPLKKGGQISLWGMGGKSEIKIMISDQKELSKELYGEGDRDQYFGTAMVVGGLTYKKPISENTFITSTFATSFENQHSHHNLLIRSLDTMYQDGNEKVTINVDSIYPIMGYRFNTMKYSGMFALTHKLNKKHIIKVGMNADFFTFNMLDSVLSFSSNQFVNRWNYSGQGGLLIQPFFQWKYRITEKMDFTAGLHAQYYSFSNSLSAAEPRLGWKWQLKGNQKLSAGAGLHSQTQPLYNYTFHLTDPSGGAIYHNKHMGFTRSVHTALGYEKNFNKGYQIRTEVYYQYLFDVPVSIHPSAFSMINQGSGFARFFPDTLVNKGTGENYGFELTFQKYFSQSFYILATASIYNSTYKGSDGVKRNTSYNGMYTANLLVGKEFKIGAKHVIGLGAKVTVAGGKRYGYVDLPRTQAAQELVYSDSLFNERKFRDYFRADFKISWKMNAKKVTHEIGLDLVNILNTKNILSLAYAPNLANPTAEPIAQKMQLGFLPIFYYRISFKLGKRVRE